MRSKLTGSEYPDKKCMEMQTEIGIAKMAAEKEEIPCPWEVQPARCLDMALGDPENRYALIPQSEVRQILDDRKRLANLDMNAKEVCLLLVEYIEENDLKPVFKARMYQCLDLLGCTKKVIGE